ncbi:hypothetical protein BH10PSE7_BH10PSE7_03230 [soil metagenome]
MSALLRYGVILCLALGLAACSSAEKLLNKVTGDDNTVLPGTREDALGPSAETGDDTAQSTDPIVLPAAQTNEGWMQPGGSATNSLGNLSLGPNLSRIWSSDVGTGSGDGGRVVASPIVAGGRIFVLDADLRVTAISANGGGQLWRSSLVPEGKKDNGFGGGIASDGSRVYATTIFGEAIALDAASGGVVWRKTVGSPVRGAPTIADGNLYFTSSANSVFALRASDGSEIWKSEGIASQVAVLASTSPAVSRGFVVIPSTSGEVSAFSASSGAPSWTYNLASGDPIDSASAISSIAGRPVIEGGQVFAISNGGQMGAFALANGQREWARDISGSQTPWVAGDYVFVIAGGNTAMAVSRRTGAIRWKAQLPGKLWAGPVLGGGRLLAVSSEGQLASISAQTGQVLNTTEVGEKFYIAPVIANGTIYLLSDSATLTALR